MQSELTTIQTSYRKLASLSDHTVLPHQQSASQGCSEQIALEGQDLPRTYRILSESVIDINSIIVVVVVISIITIYK